MLRKTWMAAAGGALLAVSTLSSLTNSALAAPLNASEAAAKPVSEAAKRNLLNVNTASANELSSVMVGVGLKRAEAIIKLREQLGGFTELEQLLDVKGIGLKTLEKNRSLIAIE